MMTEKEKDFNALVVRLQSPNFGKNFDPVLLHGFMGMASEAGEILDEYKKWMAYPGEEYTRTTILTEMSDLLHFMVYVLNRFESSIDELMDINRAKLTTRFPEGFTSVKGVTKNRDKESEKIAVDKVIAEYTRRRELAKFGVAAIGKDGRVDNS